MPSQEHESIIELLQARPRPENPTVEESRAGFEQLSSMFPLPADVEVDAVSAGGVDAEWVRAPGASHERVLLYLHGGGYVIGSTTTHRELVSRLSRASGSSALSLDYRLAPEHPFPAAIEDATAAYRWLLSSGYAPANIAIAGDSAGGGLTLATLVALRDDGTPLPAAAACLSPWADLAGRGASARPGAVDDPLLEVGGLRAWGTLYAGESVDHPHASPVGADLSGLPPLLLQVGTREILLDDSTRVAERARGAGVPVELQCWEGLIHVWQLFGPNVPESADAVRQLGDFLRKNTGG